ncbi:MAG: hypothetical protein ACUVT5_01490 [Candidatus Bathyarchaeales archaeon]
MQERKRRDELGLDAATEGLLVDDEGIELGSGYSIALDNTDGVTVLHVKTYGEVDSILLRRKLQQHYPGAKIEGLTTQPTVQIAKDKPKREKKTKKQL